MPRTTEWRYSQIASGKQNQVTSNFSEANATNSDEFLGPSTTIKDLNEFDRVHSNTPATDDSSSSCLSDDYADSDSSNNMENAEAASPRSFEGSLHTSTDTEGLNESPHGQAKINQCGMSPNVCNFSNCSDEASRSEHAWSPQSSNNEDQYNSDSSSDSLASHCKQQNRLNNISQIGAQRRGPASRNIEHANLSSTSSAALNAFQDIDCDDGDGDAETQAIGSVTPPHANRSLAPPAALDASVTLPYANRSLASPTAPDTHNENDFEDAGAESEPSLWDSSPPYSSVHSFGSEDDFSSLDDRLNDPGPDTFPSHPEIGEGNFEHLNNSEDELEEGQQCNNIPAETFQLLKEKLQGPYSAIIDQKPQISRGELLLLALTLNNRFHLNFTEFECMMKMINCIFKKDIVPSTRYHLDSPFKSAANMHYYFVCPTCSHSFGELDPRQVKEVNCDICLTTSDISDLNKCLFFVMFELPAQVELLLSDPAVFSSLKNPFDLLNNHRPCVMKDLYDGEMYQRFVRSLNFDPQIDQIVSLGFSVDGSPVARSSSCEIWPLFVSILELPPKVRMHNLLLAGLWFGKKKPSQYVFLEPFIKETERLASDGFVIKSPNNQLLKMKAFLLFCCADAPARAAVQSVHQHNGSFGCNWCLHPGYNRTYCVLDDIPDLRTQQEIIRDGNAALALNHPLASVNGVTGISPCVASSYMDVVDGIILEYFHAGEHGVGRQVTVAWFGGDGADQIPYYIGSPQQLKSANSCLSKFRAPVEVRRAARTIEELSNWKGRDFENWILYFSVPVLLTVGLPIRFLRHWILFVQAMHLLLQEEVTEQQVNLAHQLLAEFYTNFEELYGKRHMTYNLHIISCHLAQNVKRWGPLWCINGYSFEAGNKDLKETIHANRGIASQVCRALSQSCALKVLERYAGTSTTQCFKTEIEKKTVKKCIYVGNDKFLGKNVSLSLTQEEKWLFNNMQVNLQNFVEVQKMIHCDCVFSTNAKQDIKTDNSVALMQNGTIVLIKKIIVSEQVQKAFILGNIIHTSPHLSPPRVTAKDSFLKRVQYVERETKAFVPSEMKTVCVRLTVEQGDFLVKVPNVYNTC